jgi:uncharacterized membrane protein
MMMIIITMMMIMILIMIIIIIFAGAADAGAMEGRTSAANADRAATLEASVFGLHFVD